ncbi:MAG: glycine zipper 2TM domain-containing protein [Candidatus Omnitrophota bacterium]
MKKIFMSALCLGFAFITLGCQGSKTRAGEGALLGGLLGAAAGGIIGHQSRHGGEGAAIGAAAGVVTGAIVGSQIEKEPQQAAVTQTPAVAQAQEPAVHVAVANPNQMSIQQIIDFTDQKIDEKVIIDKIRLSNSRFNLSTDDIAYLEQHGVSQEVIDAMQG